MRVLVDGNNLIFALRRLGTDVGRAALAQLLGEFAAQTALPVAVVFDGPPPRRVLEQFASPPGVQVFFSHSRSADEVLAELIAAHTAPRRLTVVSSDHAVQRQAHKRRCAIIGADQFAERLLTPPAPKRASREPPAKRRGLTEDQARWWLRQFGLADDADSTDLDDQP